MSILLINVVTLAVWCSKECNSQLHRACESYRDDVTEVLRLVYSIGHKVNVQDNYGNTSLHRACYNGHSDFVKTLMLAGADKSITNDLGKTPTQQAESMRQYELLKLLHRDSLWHVITKQRKKFSHLLC